MRIAATGLPAERHNLGPVAAVGDIDGNGRTDLLVGAPNADRNGRTDSGSAYVVLTPAGNHPVDLNDAGTDVVRFDGAAAGDGFGFSVAGLGADRTGDGVFDFAVGAPGDDHAGSAAGAVFFLSGRLADGRAPDTTITAGPSGTVPPPSASFAFVSSEAGSTFACRLDGARIRPVHEPARAVGPDQRPAHVRRAGDRHRRERRPDARATDLHRRRESRRRRLLLRRPARRRRPCRRPGRPRRRSCRATPSPRS